MSETPESIALELYKIITLEVNINTPSDKNKILALYKECLRAVKSSDYLED